jgi:hypothetical protein
VGDFTGAEFGASERDGGGLAGRHPHTDCGGTYSFEEIADWLGEAGFVNPRTIDTHGPSPLILATKP